MRHLQELNHRQIAEELRKELTASERIRELLLIASRNFADKSLRQLYKHNDASILIRQAGIAEGVELFVADITKLPNGSVPKDRRTQLATRK